MRVGQAAVLRFSAFNSAHDAGAQRRGDGGVRPTSRRTSAPALSYYTVRIAVSPDEMARLGELKLVPGMPVEVFVQTDGAHGRVLLRAAVPGPDREGVSREISGAARLTCSCMVDRFPLRAPPGSFWFAQAVEIPSRI